MLRYKKFYVTNNYKTQEQIQGILGTTHLLCTSLFFPQKFGQRSACYTWQYTVHSSVEIKRKKTQVRKRLEIGGWRKITRP